MENAGEVKLRVFRFDPTRDESPRYEEYTVPRKPRMRVLDVLNHVYDEQDVDLAYRWFCGTKKCGECAVNVNGTPMLSCWEPAPDELTCEPLPNFPVVRDLVVDTASYERIVVGLRPWMTRRVAPVFPERIPHTEMARANHLSKCIECNVCTAAAPVSRLTADGVDWESGAGAAALVRFSRFVLDPRDETDRRSMAERAGLEAFPLMPILRKICPQGIDVVEDALLPARRMLFATDDAEVTEVGGSSAPFVMGAGWSGFVRLADPYKRALRESGALAPASIDGIPEAYRFRAAEERASPPVDD